jgi:hypothetical protein
MKKNSFYHHLSHILVFALLFSALVSPNHTSAQEQPRESTPFDLSISPTTAYLKLNPGNVSAHSITIKNNGIDTLSVTPTLVSFYADGTTGNPVLSGTSEFPYLDMDKTSFNPLELPPKATAQLTLHFSVPASAEDKEYPLTVLFNTKNTTPPSDPSLTPVSGTIGSNIIVLVSNKEFLEDTFTVESFAKHHFIDSFAKLKFAPVVKNNSFAAAAASGSATLKDWRGNTIANYEITPTVILGYSSRQIEPLSNLESIADEKGIRLFAYDSPFLIGPYSFSIYLPSGDAENPINIEHKIIVWAIPFALLISIAIAAFALGGYYYKKRFEIL